MEALLAQDVVAAAQSTFERWGALGLVAIMIVGGGYCAWVIGNRLVDAINRMTIEFRENTKETKAMGEATRSMHRDLVDGLGDQVAETKSLKLSMEQLARLRGQ